MYPVLLNIRVVIHQVLSNSQWMYETWRDRKYLAV